MNAEEISNFINKKSIAAINSMKWAHNAQKFDMQDKNHLFWKAIDQVESVYNLDKEYSYCVMSIAVKTFQFRLDGNPEVKALTNDQIKSMFLDYLNHLFYEPSDAHIKLVMIAMENLQVEEMKIVDKEKLEEILNDEVPTHRVTH